MIPVVAVAMRPASRRVTLHAIKGTLKSTMEIKSTSNKSCRRISRSPFTRNRWFEQRADAIPVVAVIVPLVEEEEEGAVFRERRSRNQQEIVRILILKEAR